MRDTQGTPVKLWWRAPLKVQGCVLSGSGVGGSSGEVLSTLGARCSSLILVGLLLSGCERLHSTYFRDLVSICGIRASLLWAFTLVVPGESTSALASEPIRHFFQWPLFSLQPWAPVKLQRGTPGAS